MHHNPKTLFTFFDCNLKRQFLRRGEDIQSRVVPPSIYILRRFIDEDICMEGGMELDCIYNRVLDVN